MTPTSVHHGSRVAAQLITASLSYWRSFPSWPHRRPRGRGLNGWRSVVWALAGSTLVIAIVALLGARAPADAALIAVRSNFGDDTITLDTVSGLNWLDLTVTQGLSMRVRSGRRCARSRARRRTRPAACSLSRLSSGRFWRRSARRRPRRATRRRRAWPDLPRLPPHRGPQPRACRGAALRGDADGRAQDGGDLPALRDLQRCGPARCGRQARGDRADRNADGHSHGHSGLGWGQGRTTDAARKPAGFNGGLDGT